MKSLTEHLTFTLPARMAFRNITPEVEALVERSGIREGLCLVNAMHITASVFINDDEPGLHEDYARWLEELAPFSSSQTSAWSVEYAWVPALMISTLRPSFCQAFSSRSTKRSARSTV